MAVYQKKDLCIGNRYKLAEFIEGNEVSSGNYFLVSFNDSGKEDYPILGFSKSKDGKVTVFLKEGHAQFGDPTWRRAFKNGSTWDIYEGPVGSITWNFSYVKVSTGS